MEVKHRFLIIKIGSIGDIFYTFPALQLLKEAYPNSQIDWLISESLSPLLEKNKLVNQIISIKSDLIYKGTLLDKIKNIFKIRNELQKNYDQIFIFHRSLGFLSLVIGKGPVRILARKKSLLLKTLGITAIVHKKFSVHESEKIFDSVIDHLKNLEFSKSDKNRLITNYQFSSDFHYLINENFANRHLNPQKTKTIGLHIGGGQSIAHEFKLKQWPKFDQLVQKILNYFPDYQLVLIGTKSEVTTATELINYLKTTYGDTSKIINLVNKTSLTELVTIISRCQFFIGVDSGPLHIADFLRIPSIGIYGPTSTISWGLIGNKSLTLNHKVACQPCYQDDGKFIPCENSHQCMTLLDADYVFSQFKELVLNFGNGE